MDIAKFRIFFERLKYEILWKGGRRLRTLIKMMAAMRVIPQSRPRHGADVPPEAVLVKNVIAEMHNSMSVLTDLVRYLRADIQWALPPSLSGF